MESMDAQKAYKKYVSSMERSVHFWSEARGESRKITADRLKCAPHSDAAESLALTIWERMRPEQFGLVTEMDRLLTAHDEIRVAELRETLGQILEAVNVEIKELRAVHAAPIEALTLLLNHIIKIYNQRDVDSETSSDSFVPVSTRIEQMVARAKELGLGNIEIPKNMYVSERAKMAMVEKQIIGRMKLKSLRSGSKIHDVRSNIKFKIDGARKRDETKKRLKKAVAIKERLKLQNDKGNLKLRRSKRAMRKYSSFLKSDGDRTDSRHSLSSGTKHGNEDGENASIDTSSWVISSSHKYYFGCSPPVIPKTSVTHEVYPKPVEDSEMNELENARERDLRFFHDLGTDEEAHWVAPDGKFAAKRSLDKVVLASVKEIMSDTDCDIVREEMSTASSGSRESLSMVTTNDEINCEESHGDASTIFAWTEPEKSHSFCMNSAENIADVGTENLLTQASSDAAGDGCDLARTKEESSIHTLQEEETEVSPPAAFSMTGLAAGIDSNCSMLSDNSPAEVQKKNLFSCNQFPEKPGHGVPGAHQSSNTAGSAVETPGTKHGEQDSQGTADDSGGSSKGDSGDNRSIEESSETTPLWIDESLETASAATEGAEPVNYGDSCISRSQAEPQLTFTETITMTIRPMKTEKIVPAQKYVIPSSSASSTANQTLSKSIMDELTVEILRRNSVNGNSEAKKETSKPAADAERDVDKVETSQTGDLSMGDNIILDSSFLPPQSLSDTKETQNEYFSEQGTEPEMSQASQPGREPVAAGSQEQRDDRPAARMRETISYTDVPSNKSVDEFSSAHDFGGTQLLYIRPDSLKTKFKSPNTKEASGRSRVTDDPRPSVSSHSEYEAVSDATSSQACNVGGETKKHGKRNDMVTLAVLAFALGLGTLGFMTSSGAGSGGIFSEMLGPAGGKALNIIEKALQVLKTLNNRH